MDEITAELRAKLENRIREQIASEIRGEVSALYEFTLPAIRARRIAERDDEPGLSLSQIQEFVAIVRSAVVESIEIETFHPALERFAGCPAATVVTRVRDNQRSQPCRFRGIWVYSDGNWFTTSLGKLYFGNPTDPAA